MSEGMKDMDTTLSTLKLAKGSLDVSRQAIEAVQGGGSVGYYELSGLIDMLDGSIQRSMRYIDSVVDDLREGGAKDFQEG